MTTEESTNPTVDIKAEEKPTENGDEAKTKRPVTKEKLRSIMEAASALTALGDEEDGEDDSQSEDKKDNDGENDGSELDESGKRFIPDHKKPDAALTFPEKVSHVETVISDDFVIRYRCYCSHLDSNAIVVICSIAMAQSIETK